MFPCATGDENYIGGAVETMEGIRLIKQAIPDVRTILGISNVSFGLPAGAREVVNSVFLSYCTKAGLDLAIVNTEKIERFASIPAHERELAENLLFSHPPRSLPADHSNTRTGVNKAKNSALPSISSGLQRSPSTSALPRKTKRLVALIYPSTTVWRITFCKARAMA